MAQEKQLKTSDVFDKAFISQISDILTEEKERLEKELGQFAHKNPNEEGDYNADFPNYGDEEDDNAREVADFTVNKTLEVTLEKKLRDVNAALKRIKDNSYGICKYTGQPIEKKRLLARPTSSSSVQAKKVLTNEA